MKRLTTKICQSSSCERQKKALMLISKSNKVTRSNSRSGWKDVWCVYERRGYDCIVGLPAPGFWQSNCAESRAERCQYRQIGRVHLTRCLLLTTSWSITIELRVVTTLCIDMFVYRPRCASYSDVLSVYSFFVARPRSWMRMETVNAEWPPVTVTLRSWDFIDDSLHLRARMSHSTSLLGIMSIPRSLLRVLRFGDIEATRRRKIIIHSL